MDIKALGIGCVGSLLLLACSATPTVDDGQMMAKADAPAAGTETAASGDAQPVDPDDEVICKKIVVTGSRFSKKVCAPREAWERSEEYGEEATEELQRKPIWNENE